MAVRLRVYLYHLVVGSSAVQPSRVFESVGSFRGVTSESLLSSKFPLVLSSLLASKPLVNSLD
jgi:hypothetical protein